MKTVKLNKKGFTLIELLAVIVILALLIIITANTILPMLETSKQNAMVVYAERVLSNATAKYQADHITGGDEKEAKYSVKETMDTDEKYYGCVMVKEGTDGLEFSLALYDDDNELGILTNAMKKATYSEKAKDVATKDIYGKKALTKESADTDTECESYSTYTVGS